MRGFDRFTADSGGTVMWGHLGPIADFCERLYPSCHTNTALRLVLIFNHVDHGAHYSPLKLTTIFTSCATQDETLLGDQSHSTFNSQGDDEVEE